MAALALSWSAADKPGQLDQDAVVALRLDERFGDAELIHAFAQHFDRMGEGGAGIRGLGQPVGVHAHEEGGAALQVEAQPDASGGLALQAVQDDRSSGATASFAPKDGK